jgi:cytochrome oxidase Cu insertion factor (SCO1/SenC/PrrC family)
MRSLQTLHRMFVAVALSLVLPVWSTEMRAGITATNLPKTAPDFILEDSNGARLKLSDYKGRIVLLGFWAT